MTAISVSTTDIDLVALDEAWEDHVDNHSFADGTADPKSCAYCATDVEDGSWTDAFVQ